MRRTDRRLAQKITSWRRELFRVTRDDLSQPICSSPRVLKKALLGHLRSKRTIRRPSRRSQWRWRGQIKDLVSIRERPAEIEDRAVLSLEGDLLSGRRQLHRDLVELIPAM